MLTGLAPPAVLRVRVCLERSWIYRQRASPVVSPLITRSSELLPSPSSTTSRSLK